MARTETSVLISGAGPVGLALACELGLRGVDCVLIEKRDGAIAVPKMSAISPRNMEFCRRWGIADTVRTAVWPESRNADFVFLDHLRGRELARSRRPTTAQRGALAMSPETACHCPQFFFDPILAARARSLPGAKLGHGVRLGALRPAGRGAAPRPGACARANCPRTWPRPMGVSTPGHSFPRPIETRCSSPCTARPRFPRRLATRWSAFG